VKTSTDQPQSSPVFASRAARDALAALGRPVGLRPGERWRAIYASDPQASRGRLHDEPPSPTRSPFQRDRDRIIHSTAFRRLKHKTQVFVEHEGDHYRTRLTHTLEVAQIARSIARALGLDEDLAETLALAHDLGHTPFGHAGERALERALAPWGGFDHNAQSLRIVTELESRYPAFDGLNLTVETLEGLVKHNGPLVDAEGRALGKHAGIGIPSAILAYDRRHPLSLASHGSAEAQAAAIADDIAYDAHDIDDGLRSGVLSLADLAEVPFLRAILAAIAEAYPGLDPDRTTHELQRRVITAFVEGVIADSEARLSALAPASCDAIRWAGMPVVAFGERIAVADNAIKDFLFPRLYRSRKVMAIMDGAETMVAELFSALMARPERMPEAWMAGWAALDERARAIHVADYIAGMTDRYARARHRELVEAV
jgi:dGTPase